MRQLSFKRHRFPPAIIRHSIWLYARFNLRFRDVQEMLAERGLDVSYETVRRWFLKFGSSIAANLRRTRPAIRPLMTCRKVQRCRQNRVGLVSPGEVWETAQSLGAFVNFDFVLPYRGAVVAKDRGRYGFAGYLN